MTPDQFNQCSNCEVQQAYMSYKASVPSVCVCVCVTPDQFNQCSNCQVQQAYMSYKASVPSVCVCVCDA